jgi:hypothetical protein
MKRNFVSKLVILAILSICVITTTSCRKYNYTNRIIKTWVISSYYKNGEDSTSNFKNVTHKNYEIIFNNNYGFTESYVDEVNQSITNQGTWDFTSKAKNLELNMNGVIRTYEVVSIKSKSMDLKISEKGEEFNFSPK